MEKDSQNLDMESVIHQQVNPYTHELNFDNITNIADVIEVLKNLQISINPAEWGYDNKYIKHKTK